MASQEEKLQNCEWRAEGLVRGGELLARFARRNGFRGGRGAEEFFRGSDESFARVRLLQETGLAIEFGAEIFGFHVTGSEDDTEIRIESPKMFGELGAGHVGKNDVGEEQVGGIDGIFDEVNGILGAGGPCHSVARRRKKIGSELEDGAFVFDDENVLTPPRMRGCGFLPAE